MESSWYLWKASELLYGWYLLSESKTGIKRELSIKINKRKASWIVFRRTIQEAIRILTKRYKKEQNAIRNKEYTTPTE